MKILLHSSKTMKTVPFEQSQLSTPQFIDQARELNNELTRLDAKEISLLMNISNRLADNVAELTRSWQSDGILSPAALTFRGDIYSGLQAKNWDETARAYASKHLWILSGLYGILRPFDGIWPYRLEMGYPLRVGKQNLYEYWDEALAPLVVLEEVFINVTSDEYLRAIKKSLGNAKIISPKFLSVSPKTGEPIFVTVHAKVARGAFANWLITHQIEDIDKLHEFNDLGYRYNKILSTEDTPVFVCKEFGGIGLSTRLA